MTDIILATYPWAVCIVAAIAFGVLGLLAILICKIALTSRRNIQKPEKDHD